MLEGYGSIGTAVFIFAEEIFSVIMVIMVIIIIYMRLYVDDLACT
jgi:hypothetical protein